MAFFPESIMPSRRKDESQDVKGNRFIVTAADFNKHDDEIRAIERVVGIRRARFPVAGFSGVSDSVDGFSGICADSERVDGRCPEDSAPGCSTSPQDMFQTLSLISESLSDFRDNAMLMDSGLVAIKDPSIPAADGLIQFPDDWPITTLVSDIPDDSADIFEPLENLESVELSDVSGLPEGGGFVTIINDMSTILFRSGTRNIRLVGFTSLATTSNPIYSQSSIDLQDSVARKQRIFGLGTNVEILEYESIDAGNNLLLNVTRKSMGTTSTRHAAGDLVFKGRVSISVSPVSYALSRQRMDQVECYLRSNGKISMFVRNSDNFLLDDSDDDDTIMAYANYHAVLLREIEPIPAFEPGEFGNCQESA